MYLNVYPDGGGLYYFSGNVHIERGKKERKKKKRFTYCLSMETGDIPIWKLSKLLCFVLLPIRSEFGFVHVRVVCVPIELVAWHLWIWKRSTDNSLRTDDRDGACR
jgi:hypothetical protein